jgi:tetratricopeptide (TPR) repeat protein
VSDKMNMADKMAVFLTERRALVIISLIAVVLIIVAAAVWTPIRQNLIDKNAMAAEEVEDLYSQWTYAMDDDKAELEEQFLTTTEAILVKGGTSYARQRALFVRGQYYIVKEMWVEASADFTQLADDYSDSYLAPIALFNSASTMEEAGNNDMAIEFYQRVVDEYSDSAAEALFNLARLTQEAGDNDKAREYYETLVADYSDTDWKNIAKSRILLMN